MVRTLLLLLLAAAASVRVGGGVQTNRTPPAQRDRVEVQEAPHLPPVTPRYVTSGSRKRDEIALTFDACAIGRRSGYDQRIVDELLRTKTPATFFLGGRWMESHPDPTRRLGRVPFFELGNHTFDHPHPTAISAEALRRELRQTQLIQYRLTGKQGLYFRPPYGECDSSVVRTAASVGLTTIEFDLPSGDPDSSLSAERIVRYVVREVRNGSIIVMHINGRGWRTAETLPRIIEGLRRRHFSFVTISELLRSANAAKP